MNKLPSVNSRQADLILKGGTVVTATNNGTMEEGTVIVKNGKIVELDEADSPRFWNDKAKVIDCRGKFVVPGFVDCHTHLLEGAPGTIHRANGRTAKMAGLAYLLAAMRIGVTSFGEHVLGLPGVIRKPSEFRRDVRKLPVNIKFSSGIGCVGTEPITFTTTATPGRLLTSKEVTDDIIIRVARLGEFPGENFFPTASPSNLTPEKVPHAGEIMLDKSRIQKLVSLFHHERKRVGAHIEGPDSMKQFAQAGGDVIHHAHGLDKETAQYLKHFKVKVVATPAAGTSRPPNSPAEIVAAFDAGVEISIATDSYIPLHKEATWVPMPRGSWIGPEHLLKVANGAFKALRDNGTELNEIIKLITLNPAAVLGLDKIVGSLSPGKNADIVIMNGFPGLDGLDESGAETVIKDGFIEIGSSISL